MWPLLLPGASRPSTVLFIPRSVCNACTERLLLRPCSCQMATEAMLAILPLYPQHANTTAHHTQTRGGSATMPWCCCRCGQILACIWQWWQRWLPCWGCLRRRQLQYGRLWECCAIPTQRAAFSRRCRSCTAIVIGRCRKRPKQGRGYNACKYSLISLLTFHEK